MKYLLSVCTKIQFMTYNIVVIFMNILEVKNISKKYGSIKAIENISLKLNKGEILAIIGPSGCGKSTLLNIISGLDKSYSGSVLFSEKNPKISYMFQEDALLESKNVYKNSCLGLDLMHTKDKNTYIFVNKLLKEYGLDEYKDKDIKTLSGGMKKRVALIRALAIKPNFLFLDEPFSALDYSTRIKISEDVLKEIKKEKITTIIITHDIEEAISLADKIIVLTKGPSIIKNTYQVLIDKNLSILDKKKTKRFNVLLESIWSDLDE